MNGRVSRGVLSAIILLAFLSISGKALAQGGASHFAPADSGTYSWKWMTKHVGGDLFLSAEIYGLHLTGVGSLTNGAGVGAEVRVHPLFLGAVVGICGDEGIPYIPHSGIYSFYSLYVGITLHNYRAELGEIQGDSRGWVGPQSGVVSYTSGFLGISKRWSGIFFFEPEVKIMFPIVADGYVGERFPPDEWVRFREHYQPHDLFFALSVKVGVGFN